VQVGETACNQNNIVGVRMKRLRYLLALTILTLALAPAAFCIEDPWVPSFPDPEGVLPLPPGPPSKGRNLTLVIVCGSPAERAHWTGTARAHFGSGADLSSEVHSLAQLGQLLATRYQPHSIRRLVIGAHGNAWGPWLGANYFRADIVNADGEAADAIADAMAPNGLIDFQCCSAAQGGRGRRNLQDLANLLGVRIRGADGIVGPWDDARSRWIIVAPLALPPPTGGLAEGPDSEHPPAAVGLLGLGSGTLAAPAPVKPRTRRRRRPSPGVTAVVPEPATVPEPAIFPVPEDPPDRPRRRRPRRGPAEPAVVPELPLTEGPTTLVPTDPPDRRRRRSPRRGVAEPAVVPETPVVAEPPVARTGLRPTDRVDRTALPPRYRGTGFTATVSTDGRWVEVRSVRDGSLEAHIPIEEIRNGTYRARVDLRPDSTPPTELLPPQYRGRGFVARVSANGRYVQIMESGTNAFVAQIPVDEIRNRTYASAR
jgi:hypothetical protein